MFSIPQTEVQKYILASTSTGKRKKKQGDFCGNDLGITTLGTGITLWTHCCFMPTTSFLISYGKCWILQQLRPRSSFTQTPTFTLQKFSEKFMMLIEIPVFIYSQSSIFSHKVRARSFLDPVRNTIKTHK